VRFLRWVRSKYPFGGRIYLIQDNLSTHTTPAAVAEARRLRMTFVPTPTTNASHLNPIETHFRTIRRWAFTRTNYTDWGEVDRGAYPCRFRQVSWWGFGGGSGVTETDENDRRLPPSAEVP
jgi:DDE superfamily endonuclease